MTLTIDFNMAQNIWSEYQETERMLDYRGVGGQRFHCILVDYNFADRNKTKKRFGLKSPIETDEN